VEDRAGDRGAVSPDRLGRVGSSAFGRLAVVAAVIPVAWFVLAPAARTDSGPSADGTGAANPGIVAVAVAGTDTSESYSAAFSASADRSPTPLQERRLVQSLIDLRRGQLNEALRSVSDLVEEQPDFKLAQMIYGDLLLAQTTGLTGFGQRLRPASVRGHREEAKARLQRYLAAPPPATLPDSVLKLPSRASSALIVDLETYRLYLLESRAGQVTRTRDFYVSIGKGGSDKRREGDEKTPVGVYVVSDFLPGEKLPDLYGVGAFPIDYPNGWDRMHGRTGSGIWIHGTESDRYSRPPLSSRGCVTMSNDDFRDLRRLVEVEHTPVVVADGLRWIDRREAERHRRDLEQALEGWRRDWESRDGDRYLSHYSRRFRTPSMSRAKFAAYKRQVNASKKFIRVELDDLGIFSYPGERDLAVISFFQKYSSDNFKRSTRKRQYWRRENDRWRIVYEESV